jgi:hypothetical protein
VSDIQKLNKVIATLEKQSTSVSEFNGVLNAVNSAKADICSAKSAFEEIAKEQKKLVSESNTRFEEYGTKLTVLESKLSAVEKKFLTPEQFETGRDKILLRMSEQKFVSPEQFEHGKSFIEKAISDQINQRSSRIEEVITAQGKTISFLRTFVVFGVLVLVGLLAYLVVELAAKI